MDIRKTIISLVCIILLLSAPAWSREFSVLILNGATDGMNNEASVLKSFTSVEGHTFTFDEIGVNWQGNTHPVPGSIVLGQAIQDGQVDLMQYDIIWLTWNGPGHDGDYFMEGAEEAMLEFVMQGGCVWISAFDDNYQDQNGDQIGGWMPIDDFPASIMNTSDSDAQITTEGAASGLFDVPNLIDLNSLVLDDNFAGLGSEYIILAERMDNGQPAALLLPYGRGSYVEVCIDARSTFPAAEPLLENGLAYLARLKILTVDVDIKPGSYPNPINLKSKGAIPVAILTDEDFDAADIDPLTVRFGPDEASECNGKGHPEDVDGDGDTDMVLHFRVQESGITADDEEVIITGSTNDGREFMGRDSIRIVGVKAAPSMNPKSTTTWADVKSGY